MASPRTLADLRAACPSCYRPVAVRRQGATWRMVAHKREGTVGWRRCTVACDVRGVDALPFIRAWLVTRERSAADLDTSAAKATAEATRLAGVAAAAAADAATMRADIIALAALLDGAAQ